MSLNHCSFTTESRTFTKTSVPMHRLFPLGSSRRSHQWPMSWSMLIVLALRGKRQWSTRVAYSMPHFPEISIPYRIPMVLKFHWSALRYRGKPTDSKILTSDRLLKISITVTITGKMWQIGCVQVLLKQHRNCMRVFPLTSSRQTLPMARYSCKYP